MIEDNETDKGVDRIGCSLVLLLLLFTCSSIIDDEVTSICGDVFVWP